VANFPSVITMPGECDRVLVIAPHPDDETIAAGGLIAGSVAAGAAVALLLVTDGNRRGLGALRAGELDRAVDALGLGRRHVVRLGYRDGFLARDVTLERLAGVLQQHVEAFQPTWVVAPHPRDRHLDHRLIGEAAERLALPTPCPLYRYLVHFPGYPRPFGSVPRGPLLPPRALAAEGGWGRLELSAELVRRKREALRAHASQLANPLLTLLLLSFMRTSELFHVRDGEQRA
jgi:LmbE family N-acetylglucosaminyl deacetylase